MLDFDVVIVGGRPAGATLAARLGRRGVRVLIVDRARFPSLPGVPSSPVLHTGAMRLLDELGIAESRYGLPDAKMHAVYLQFHTYFRAQLSLIPVWGRDYVYGLDRRHFDHVLWEHLANLPSVTRLEGFAVSDLIRDPDGRVVGIAGADSVEPGSEGPRRELRAGCVIGADGRFSLVARKVQAPVVQEEREHLSTVYYADWEGVDLTDEGPAPPTHREGGPPAPRGAPGACIYTTGRGLDVPIFRMPRGLASVNLHIRADRVTLGGSVQRYYEDTLKAHPLVWRRLAGAKQVAQVVGLKRIGNGYRKASGPGWALVGDALHYKDPVDGQGIYDALLEARLLDEAMATVQSGERTWEQAMAGYELAVHAKTETMFKQTVGRLKRELYQEPPPFVIKTFLRWLMTDPAYQDRYSHYLSRALPGDRLLTPTLVGGAVLRGLGRDASRLWRKPSSAG